VSPTAKKPAPGHAKPGKYGLVAFVGAGPGDESLLTRRAAELLGRADLVAGPPQLTGRLAHLVREGATVAGPDDPEQEPAALAKAAKAGQVVVQLCEGDPLLFGGAASAAAA
jgi:uroporphyrinogen III methyltransferase/synthase